MNSSDRPADVIAKLSEKIAAQDLADLVSHLASFDRRQGSAGLIAAADYIAGEAARRGLEDVATPSFPADDSTTWWTFRAPPSWTPLRADISVQDGPPLASYPAEPFSIATYSAATPADGIQGIAVDGSVAADVPWRDRIVLVSAQDGDQLDRAVRESAAAVLVGSAGPTARVELDARRRIPCLSIGDRAYQELQRACRAAEPVRIRIAVDERPASFPVVTGLIPGDSSIEILLMSHLCHTGPGADDNGSGCAALLGIASAIGGCDFRLPVSLRFLWTPEMVGTAAWAHTRGTGQPPECVINLDMAGQNQQVCGGGLTLERPHDMVSSALVPVADAVMDRLPRPMSYSGAVPSPPWGWTWTPYVGASDHLIYADSRPRVATIQLGHWPDRFNNSSADAADHVDPGELGRATLIAAATAVLMATLTEADDSWLRRATQAWAIRFVAAPAEWPAREHPADGDVIDPHDPAWLAEVLRYRLTVVQRVLRATSWWVPDSSWPDAFLTALGRLADSISGAGGEHASRSRTSGGPVVRRWDGPFNLRHVLDQASAESDAWLFDRMRNDPRATLAAVTSVVMAIDGSRSVAELASFAACQSELPISRTLVSELIALLARLGLVSVSGPAPRRPGGRR